MAYVRGNDTETVRAAVGGAEAVLLVGRKLQAEIDKLTEVVSRQDLAIDVALAALHRLAQKGSITKQVREQTIALLIEAKNESLELGVTAADLRTSYQARLETVLDALGRTAAMPEPVTDPADMGGLVEQQELD